MIVAFLIELVYVQKEVIIAILLFGSTSWLDILGGILRFLENKFVELKEETEQSERGIRFRKAPRPTTAKGFNP
jgi:hypothetical protein